jgi:hypothetical protein
MVGAYLHHGEQNYFISDSSWLQKVSHLLPFLQWFVSFNENLPNSSAVITLNSRGDNLKDSTQKDVKDKVDEQSTNQITPINKEGNDVFTLTKGKGVGIESLHSLHIRWLQANIAHKLLTKTIGKRLFISNSQMHPHCKNQWVWLFIQGYTPTKRGCSRNYNNLLKQLKEFEWCGHLRWWKKINKTQHIWKFQKMN